MYLKQKPDQPPAELHDLLAHEHLRYVTDTKPGFSRRKSGKSFKFFDTHGQLVKDAETVQRIKSIGVPPAYQRVWISPWANGHIQATGYDARGRKQYRYHTRWRAARDHNKFDHMLQFGAALPKIRRAVTRDLKSGDLSRRAVVAGIVSLLEKTLIRVGNESYARDNHSYGLTTLRRRHVAIKGEAIHFHFLGKSNKVWDIDLHDQRIAALLKRCSDLPGQDLFKFTGEDGAVHHVTSADVNDYLKDVTGQDFTAKDFRTWTGTVLAAVALKELYDYKTSREAKKNLTGAIEHVAKQLGNTPSICRKCYIHPTVVVSYLKGDLVRMIENRIDEKFRAGCKGMSADEIMVLAFLRLRLEAYE